MPKLSKSETLLFQRSSEAAAREHAAIDAGFSQVLNAIAEDHGFEPGKYRIGEVEGHLVIESLDEKPDIAPAEVNKAHEAVKAESRMNRMLRGVGG